jgi:hypothetical protein
MIGPRGHPPVGPQGFRRWPGHCPPARAGVQSRLPLLEVLEDRCLLSFLPAVDYSRAESPCRGGRRLQRRRLPRPRGRQLQLSEWNGECQGAAWSAGPLPLPQGGEAPGAGMGPITTSVPALAVTWPEASARPAVPPASPPPEEQAIDRLFITDHTADRQMVFCRSRLEAIRREAAGEDSLGNVELSIGSDSRNPSQISPWC